MSASAPRIAVVAPSAPPLGGGGVASAHYQLYRGFLNEGVDAVMLTFNEAQPFSLDPEVFRHGASAGERRLLALCSALYLKALGSRRLAYHLADIFCSLPGVLRLNRALRRLQPDHIIIPDHGAPGLFLDKGKARLTLVTHHNPARFQDPLLGEFCPVDVREAVALEQRVLAKVDGVVAPSRYMEGFFCETFRYDGPVTTIHNPLDQPLIERVAPKDPRPELRLPADAPLVYIPSAGSVLKGERFVAEIIRKLSASCCGPIGFYLSGAIPQNLEWELRNAPENSRILSPGHLDFGANVALVKSCSFGVSPTLIENFGMAILEAGFCGLPMSVFDVGGNSEIVLHGENGFCVPCLDVDGLVASAAQLLDKSRRLDMGRTASRLARDRFSAEIIVKQYLDFCQANGGCGV